MQVELAGGLRLDVATAEDCVLTKLEWFEKGGRVSDRQWRDVLGVLRISGDGLDRAYLARWAQELGLDELLAAAMRERSARHADAAAPQARLPSAGPGRRQGAVRRVPKAADDGLLACLHR